MRLPPALLALALLVLPAVAQTPAPPQPPAGGSLSFGGDRYVAGQSAVVDTAVARDAFAAGYDVSLSGPVSGNAHLAGFNVTSAADVTGDLYAAGYSISITGGVGGDITAMGNSINLAAPRPVPGNLRLAGQTVTITSEVGGSALVTAQSLTLSAPVKGDVGFFGEKLSFGPNARVDGTLTIHAPQPVTVPETVASADRVHFEQLVAPDYASEAGKTAEHVVKGFWPAVWATGLWWLLLIVVGVLFITLAPRLTQSLQSVSGTRPFRRLGLGIVAFAAAVGLVPVLAMTLVGLVLVPFAVLIVVIACILAYLAGAYLVVLRVARALLPIDSNLRRLAVLAVAVVLVGLLGMIPVLGWLLSLLVLCFGFGSIATVIMNRLTSSDRVEPLPPAPTATPATA